MADRPDSESAVPGFEVRNPRGLNAIDLLTIIAVVALLALLLRATLAKQGYTIAEPWNWMRATATRIALSTFAGSATTPSPESPVFEGYRTIPANAQTSPAERIRKTERIQKKLVNKTSIRTRHPVVSKLSIAGASEAPSPWAKSDQELESVGDAG
jgi:hypothetical protein